MIETEIEIDIIRNDRYYCLWIFLFLWNIRGDIRIEDRLDPRLESTFVIKMCYGLRILKLRISYSLRFLSGWKIYYSRDQSKIRV